MCLTKKEKKKKKKKKRANLVLKSMIRNSLSHFSEFNVKFTKRKISHLNIKKKERIETVSKH
jgi:hypothetical protein